MFLLGAKIKALIVKAPRGAKQRQQRRGVTPEEAACPARGRVWVSPRAALHEPALPQNQNKHGAHSPHGLIYRCLGGFCLRCSCGFVVFVRAHKRNMVSSPEALPYPPPVEAQGRALTSEANPTNNLTLRPKTSENESAPIYTVQPFIHQ